MPRIPRLPSLSLTFLLCSFATCSLAEAKQWPVQSGPINQPLPQYRPSTYPLQSPAIDAVAPTPAPAVTQPPRQLLTEPPTALPLLRLPVANEAPQALNNVPLVPAQELKTQPPAQATSPPGRYPIEQLIPPSASPAVNLPGPLPPTPAKIKKSTAKPKQTKPKQSSSPIVDYRIYRDRNPLPIDPRKPCNICTSPGCSGCCGCEAPGLRGRPYQEREPGGCDCTKKKYDKGHPEFSLYWPRPFAAKLDERFPYQAAARNSPCQKKRCIDVFDNLIDFKLIDYHRTDNGHCGRGSDPYGCLGENRMSESGVAGVGNRFPSVPVDRSASNRSFWY